MNRNHAGLKKLLAGVLAFVMCISLLPGFVLAADDDVTFTKAANIEVGKDYLIVATSESGSVYALANDSSNIKLKVTPNGDTITLSTADADKAAWTVSNATGDALPKGDYFFTNNGSTLNRNGNENAVGFGTSNSARYGMSYTNGTLCNLNSSNTPYYLGYGSPSSGSSYTFRYATSATNNIEFYVKDDGGIPAEPDDPVEPVDPADPVDPVDPVPGKTLDLTPSTDKPSASAAIEVGETLTVNLTNGSASQSYDFKVSFDKDGAAAADQTTVHLSAGQTGSFTITGTADGTVDVTITNSNTYSERKATIHLTVGTGEGDDPVIPPVPGDTLDLTPSTDNPNAGAVIEVGEKLTVKVKNGSSSSGYTFTAVSDNAAVTVSPASATIAAGAAAEFTVTGAANGTAVVTFANENSYGAQYQRKATLNVTVVDGEDDPADPEEPVDTEVYQLTDSFEIGETYLIVNADSGSGLALANNSSRFATVSVNIVNGTIAVDNALAKAEWEAKATGTGSGLIGLYNGSNVLKVDASDSSSPYINTSSTSYNAGGFGYTANSHVSYPYGSNPRDYFIGSDSVNGFKAANTENGLGKVYIFVKTVGSADPVDPVDPVDPTPVGDDLYLIISNGYALSSAVSESYTTSGGTYTGYKGVKYTAGTTAVTADMLWNVEMNGNTYVISQNGKTLSGTYTSGVGGSLTLGSNAASWTYSNNTLKLGNGYLTHSDGTAGVNDNPNVFSLRSSSNAGTVQFARYEGSVPTPVDPVDPVDPVNPPVPGEAVYVAFTSDVHNQNGDASSNRLNNWINTVTGKLGAPFDNMGFCGDMGPASGSSNDFWSNALKVMNVVANNNNVVGNGFFVCGNHEYNPGNYSHNQNSTTQKYSDAGSYLEANDYIIYSMGARQWSEQYSDSDINDLKAYLNAESDFNGPIFILAHYPLHCYNGRTSGESTGIHDGSAAVGSSKIIAALNEASEQNGQTIFFLWGHNHSSSNDHYDAVYTDKINNTPISFTYAAAGCMSDSEYGMSSNVKGKGLVAAINSDSVTLTYYNANGAVVGTPVTVELNGASTPSVKYTVSASAGANGSITPNGTVSVTEGRSVTFTITANAGYEIDTVLVNGAAAAVSGGKLTLTNVTSDTTVHATFKTASVKTYAPADKAVAGSYILVSNGYALYNANGTISAVPVTISGGNVYVREADIAGATWTFSQSVGSDKSGDFEITNNGYRLSRVSDSSGSAMAAEITAEKKNSPESGLPFYQWTYNVADGTLSHIGGQDRSATFYTYYNTSAGAFYTSTDAQSLKLYVVSQSTVDQAVVSGSVKSYGDETGSVTILLLQDETVKYSTTVVGNEADYSIGNVAYGTYTMRAMKENHVTREYEVEVTAAMDQDVVICLLGDVTADGRVNSMDLSRLYAHNSKTDLLTDYALLCADTTGDGKVTAADTSRLYAHVSKTNPLW